MTPSDIRKDREAPLIDRLLAGVQEREGSYTDWEGQWQKTPAYPNAETVADANADMAEAAARISQLEAQISDAADKGLSFANKYAEAANKIQTLTEKALALDAQVEAWEQAVESLYSGDGLDAMALAVERLQSPLNIPDSPRHSMQVGVRYVLDKVRRIAALNSEGKQ